MSKPEGNIRDSKPAEGVSSSTDIKQVKLKDASATSFDTSHEQKSIVTHASGDLISCISYKSRKFMFEEERATIPYKAPKVFVPGRRIKFDPLAEYIEVVTLDYTRREFEEVFRGYIRTGYPSERVFMRNISSHYFSAKTREESAKFWNRIAPIKEKTPLQILTKKSDTNYDQRFSDKITFIQRNWQHGVSFEDELEETEEPIFFPDGDREGIEQENLELVTKIMDKYRLAKHTFKFDYDRFCTVFANYITLNYLVHILSDSTFKARMASILTDPVLYRNGKLYNWDLAKSGILKIIRLFEEEDDIFGDVSDQELFGFGSLSEDMIARLTNRVLVRSEGDEDDAQYFGNTRYNRPHTENFVDLISRKQMVLQKVAVPKERSYDADPSERYAKTYIDMGTSKFLTNPIPVIVPSNWQIIDIVGFLSAPWSCWNSAKMMFLKSYFDCLNQIMVSACLNDNIFLLNLIRKRPLPQAFKTKLLAMCTFAENSRLGTIQFTLRKKTRTDGKTGAQKDENRALTVTSSSFFLTPLMRADLYFSFTQHCLLSQPCSGHKGLLLLFMLRMNYFKIAKILMQEGVGINFSVCSLPAKTFRWKPVVNSPPKGCYPAPNGTNKGRDFVSSVAKTKLLAREYVNDTGFCDDSMIHEAAKGIKYTPFAVAVEAAYASCDNSIVEYLLYHQHISLSKADFVIFRALLPFFADVAKVWINLDTDVQGSESQSEPFWLLNTYVTGELYDEIQKDSDKATRLELLRRILDYGLEKEKGPFENKPRGFRLVSMLCIQMHLALMYEDWDVVRFLGANTEDPITLQVFRRVIDIVLFEIIRGHYPFPAQALNALYFLTEEFNIFFTYSQYMRLIIAVVEGILKMPSGRIGCKKPIEKLFGSKQFLSVFKFFEENDSFENRGEDFLYMDDGVEYSFNEVEQEFSTLRSDLCLHLYINNYGDLGDYLVSDEILNDVVFLKDLVRESAGAVYHAEALPKVLQVVSHRAIDVAIIKTGRLVASVSNNMSYELIMAGFLHRNNADQMLYLFLTKHIGKLPILDIEEIVADFTYIKAMREVVLFLNTKEMEDVKEEIFETIFRRLAKSDSTFWLEGLHFAIEMSKLRSQSEARKNIVAYIEDKIAYYINYDSIRDLYSLQPTHQGTAAIMQGGYGSFDSYDDDNIASEMM